jgi:hypothetical protein
VGGRVGGEVAICGGRVCTDEKVAGVLRHQMAPQSSPLLLLSRHSIGLFQFASAGRQGTALAAGGGRYASGGRGQAYRPACCNWGRRGVCGVVVRVRLCVLVCVCVCVGVRLCACAPSPPFLLGRRRKMDRV